MFSQKKHRQIADRLKAVLAEHQTERADVAAVLGMVVMDLVMSFPPEDRRFVAEGFAGMVTRVIDAAVEHYPWEFGNTQKH